MIGLFVIVRCSDSSVHSGFLRAFGGTTVEMTEKRLIWRWRGANTCSELSLHGCSLTEFTRISEPVAEAIVCEVREVIPCTLEARENLRQSRWLD